MRTPIELATLCLAALLLTACDKGPTAVPAPRPVPVTADTGTPPPASAGTSVPSADSALAAAKDKPKAAPEAGRSNAEMTRSQESSAMPMAGQSNDHSAPVAPAKVASAPT
jgi:hypothetical protein